jgi:hypothetical protein
MSSQSSIADVLVARGVPKPTGRDVLLLELASVPAAFTLLPVASMLEHGASGNVGKGIAMAVVGLGLRRYRAGGS